METSVLIGHDIQTKNDITVALAARRLSTYIIGKPGTGKSALLERIAYQDMHNGDGFCFVDPHEVSAEQLLRLVPLHRVNDVIFWDPTDKAMPFGINPFYCPDSEEIDSLSDNFLAVLGSLAEFTEVFASAPRMKSILKHLAITFMVNQGHTLAETPEFLTNPLYRPQFYPALSQEYSQVRTFWERFDQRPIREQREIVSSSLNKLERFQIDRTMRTIFGQPTNSINYRTLMDEGKILLVKLSGSRIGPDNAAFIGAFIIWGVFQAALSRSDTPASQLRPFHLLADEFQTYMSTAFPRLIEECRKFAVDITVAHQTRIQLDERSRGATMAVGNKIVFGVSARDAGELAHEFDTTPPPVEMVPEAMMEPVYERYIDENTTGPELDTARTELTHVEAQLAEVRVALAWVAFEQRLLQDAFTLFLGKEDNGPSLEVFEPDYDPRVTEGRDSVYDGLRYQEITWEQYHDPELLPDKYWKFPKRYRYAAIYRSLNPRHYGEVEDYARSCVQGVPWKDAEGRYVRKAFAFSLEFQTHAEERLEYAVKNEQYHQSLLSDEDCHALVVQVQREFLMIFLPAKQTAQYWWDPSLYDKARTWDTGNPPKQNRWGPIRARSWELTEFPEVLAWLKGRWLALRERHKEYSPQQHSLEKRQEKLTEAITQLKTQKRLTHYRPVREVSGKGLAAGQVALEDAIQAYRLKEGSRRSHDDVANEIANELTNLPPYTARCKLAGPAGPVEYTITTYPPPDMPPDAAVRAQEIRDTSRAVYGRARGEVEAQIVTRLRSSVQSLPSATILSDADDLPSDESASDISDVFDSPDI